MHQPEGVREVGTDEVGLDVLSYTHDVADTMLQQATFLAEKHKTLTYVIYIKHEVQYM